MRVLEGGETPQFKSYFSTWVTSEDEKCMGVIDKSNIGKLCWQLFELLVIDIEPLQSVTPLNCLRASSKTREIEASYNILFGIQMTFKKTITKI